MGRKVRSTDVPHTLEWLLSQSLIVADQSKLPITAARIAMAIDQFHAEKGSAKLASDTSTQVTQQLAGRRLRHKPGRTAQID